MTVSQPAQLVMDCQRLATFSAESCANGLTFVRRGGLTLDGHERSMAGSFSVCDRQSGDGQRA